MSNNITAFVLELKSTCEGEHMIFGFPILANFAYDNVLHSIHLLAKISFFFMAE
jgi:hypothetical protein